MKKEVSWVTTIVLGIITIVLAILYFSEDKLSIPMTATISLNTKIGFYYFLTFTLIMIILTLLSKNNKRRRPRNN